MATGAEIKALLGDRAASPGGGPTGRAPTGSEIKALLGSSPPAEFDPRTGAPLRVRTLVGALDKPEDRLATLRQHFPDARPDPTNPGNFIFTNPETGRPTRFNPRGLDVGDLAGVAREATQLLGGTVGGVAGAPLGLPGAMGGAALGGMAGEELFNLGARALGARDTRTLGQRGASTGTIGAFEGAGTGVGAAAGAGVRGGVRQVFRGGEAGRGEAARAVEDLAPFGASPSVAQATKSAALDSLENFLASIPGGHAPIRRAVDRVNQAVARGIEDLATRTAGRTGLDPTVAGRALREGALGFVEILKGRSETLFGKVRAAIPGNANVPVTNTMRALADVATPVPGAEQTSRAFLQPGMQRLMTAFGEDLARGQGRLPTEALFRLRSAIGRRLAEPSLVDDIPRAEMKRLYGAITKDIEAAAQTAGPDALRTFRRANDYYRAGMQRVDDLLEPLVSKAVPEKVFLALERSGKEGASLIRAARRSVKPEQWRVVAGTVVQRLGRAVPSQQGAEGAEFSFNTFLTNWNRLAPEARDALFNGTPLTGLRDSLDQIARAAGRIRESSRAFANPSGTSGALVGKMAAYFGAGGVGLSAVTGNVGYLTLPAMAGLGAIATNQAAKLMVSPRFVRWLAQATRPEIGTKAAGAHLGRLAGIAASADPETKEAIAAFVGAFDRALPAGEGPTLR